MSAIRVLLDDGIAQLREAGLEGVERDALTLLLEATGLEHVDLIADPSRPVNEITEAVFRDFLTKRCQHWPVGKIIGTTSFYGRNFHVNEHVLDPRSDSEALIDAALHWMDKTRTSSERVKILDMCTGSGCLGITLCAERPDATCLGVDVDLQALAVAEQNALALGVSDRFMGVHSEMFDALIRPFDETAYQPGPPFDLIICNPPYIRSSDIAGLMPEVRLHDPHHALDGGADGLVFYRVLLDEAREYLARDGALLMEIGFDQENDLRQMIQATHWRGSYTVIKDLGGRDRAILVTPV